MDLFEELFGIPDAEETPGKRAVRERVAGEDIHLRDIGAIAIDDVFTDDDVDLDRLSAKLEDLIELDCEKRDSTPNDLIRIVHGNEVMWLTHDQANVYLQGHNDPESKMGMMQRDIKRALKGNTRVLRQEMQTLVAMAFTSLQSYLEYDDCDVALAKKSEQQLRRKWMDVAELIVGITNSEESMNGLREKHPQLDVFERVMGEFVNARQTGDKTRMDQLRGELANMQRTYLIMARVLEPDTQALHQQRMELQQGKKTVLSIEKELAATQREGLRMEVKKLNRHLRSLKNELVNEEGPTDELQLTANLEAKGFSPEDGLAVEDVEGKIQEKKGKAEHAHLKQKVAKAQEEGVDEVLDYLESEVVGQAGVGDSMQDKISQQRNKSKTKKAPPVGGAGGKKAGDTRMATIDRRDG